MSARATVYLKLLDREPTSTQTRGDARSALSAKRAESGSVQLRYFYISAIAALDEASQT
jgi:hypothetical protein